MPESKAATTYCINNCAFNIIELHQPVRPHSEQELCTMKRLPLRILCGRKPSGHAGDSLCMNAWHTVSVFYIAQVMTCNCLFC